MRFETTKTDMAAANDVWEAKVHEMEDIVLLNNVGSDGEKPSLFNCDNNADISHRAWELPSRSDREHFSSFPRSANDTEPLQVLAMVLLPVRHEKSEFTSSGVVKSGSSATEKTRLLSGRTRCKGLFSRESLAQRSCVCETISDARRYKRSYRREEPGGSATAKRVSNPQRGGRGEERGRDFGYCS